MPCVARIDDFYPMGRKSSGHNHNGYRIGSSSLIVNRKDFNNCEIVDSTAKTATLVGVVALVSVGADDRLAEDRVGLA